LINWHFLIQDLEQDEYGVAAPNANKKMILNQLISVIVVPRKSAEIAENGENVSYWSSEACQ